MSGGSYEYICYRLEEECSGRMCDAELDDMIKDLCNLLHDLEWWQSSDVREETYRESVRRFKAKWFKGNREERLKGYIDSKFATMRTELYGLIGIKGGEKNGNK